LITLGINVGHDSGVTLLSQNKIIFAANEERFTRKKFQGGFPFQSMNFAKLVLNGEVPDQIVFEGKRQFPFRSMNDPIDPYSNKMNKILQIPGFDRIFFANQLGVELSETIFFLLTMPNRKKTVSLIHKLFKNVTEFHYVEHHAAHSASCALLYNKHSGLSYSLDAFGEGYCNHVYKTNGSELTFITKTPGYHSPGLFYYYINRLLGFKFGQEGKVTGLAAHGNFSKTIDVFRSLIDFDKKSGTFRNNKLHYGISALNLLENKLKAFSPEDIAAGAQKHLESIVCSSIHYFSKKYLQPTEALFLSGGVFANVSLNRKIHELGVSRDVFITPNMGDGGLSLGAALIHHPVKIEFENLFLGTDSGELPSDFESNWEIITLNIERLALLLSEGKVLGVCQGKMEFGPRALGNRSILASAAKAGINNTLNDKLKRTEFMPFAPIVREEDANEYFVINQNLNKYENMVTTCNVTNKCVLEAPAIVHIDGTARPQILRRELNLFLWELLRVYKEITGVGVLINTSFNIHEEPIVRTKTEALKSALEANLDGVIFDKDFVTPRFTKYN
jgi:carbamoyltransferase